MSGKDDLESGLSDFQPVDVKEGKAFGLDVERLTAINSEKDMDALKSYGGVKGVASILRSDLERGISTDSIQARQQEFGENRLPEKPPVSFFMLMVRVNFFNSTICSHLWIAISGATSRIL